MGATLGVGVRQLGWSRLQTGLGADNKTHFVPSLGMSARFDGFFSPSRQRALFDTFGPWSSATRWADTIHATIHRDRRFEPLPLPLAEEAGSPFADPQDNPLDLDGQETSPSRDPLSTEDLDRLFAEAWESVEDELFRGTTSSE